MTQVQNQLDGHQHPHIVILFSDTGGGHRSAAEAIIEALDASYPNQTSHEMVDIFRGYAPPILARIPDIYPFLASHPNLLGLIFYLSDGSGRTRLFLKILWPFVREHLVRMINEHPADLYLSVHPLINAPFGNALDSLRLTVPYITVVTDLVTAHATWFWKRSDLVVVPTAGALQRGVKNGYPSPRLRVVGLPVSIKTGSRGEATSDKDTREIRARSGWPQDRTVVLLVSGAEGMGPLEDLARAIDAAFLPVTLIIIAGRNTKLKERLERVSWQIPTMIYGFVQNMPDFMHAADILVTKAGPGTISEALAAGLPMILTSRLLGPEDGNVRYVVENKAGIWAPRTNLVLKALAHWLDHPEERALAARACLQLARPEAAKEIANLILQQVKTPAYPIKAES